MTAAGIHTTIQRLCIWCGPAFLVTFGVFFVLVAGFVPPPSPTWSAQVVAGYYDAHRVRIRVGLTGGLCAIALMFPFWAAISTQIARLERTRLPSLGLIQFGGAVLLLTFFQGALALWLVASFRTDLEPDTVRTLNDTGWLIFVLIFPCFVLQMIAIAIAALLDQRPGPMWPRWSAYLTLWLGLVVCGGGLAVFFKTGPFAWNGLVAFYLPLGLMGAWICLVACLVHTGLRRHPMEGDEPAAHRTVSRMDTE